jgi:cold shock CspA family protein
MTGKIEDLIAERRLGYIRAEDGSHAYFYASAVVGSDFDFLAVGQLVSFDLERGGKRQNAIRVQPELVLRKALRKTEAVMQLQYMGFEQAQSLREYRFDGVVHGEKTKHFVVSADLALFVQHHVGMQEGPVLSLRKLSADLESASEQLRHELTGDDLLAYVTARTAAAELRQNGHRKWRPHRKPVTQAAQGQ